MSVEFTALGLKHVGCYERQFMNDPFHDNLQPVEDQLARWRQDGAPPELRTVVLRQVRRELRAACWDRRLARVAAVLLIVGVGINVAIVWQHPGPAGGHVATRPTLQAIGELAATVAEATDVETATLFARQMASLRGWPARGEEATIIEREIQRRLSLTAGNGKDG